MLVRLVLILALLAPAATGQFRAEEHPTLGLKVQRPLKYKAVPTTPTEKFIVLRYVEDVDKRNPKEIQPALHIVRIDWVPDPEPEPEPIEEEEEEEDEDRSRSKPEEEEEEKKPPPPPISTLERYVEQRLGDWELRDSEKGKRKQPFEGTVHRLSYVKKEKRPSGYAGWVYEWENPEKQTFAVLGFCHEDDLKAQIKIWRKVAEKLEISEPTESKETAKWRRFYERRPKFKNPEFRLKIRDQLVGDWKAEDSENYILIYSTSKEKLIRDLMQRLEAIRKAYIELFPAAAPITAVSAVRICRDRDEYLAYGGSPRSGGYWYDKAEELVFYDYADRKGDRGSGKANSRIVLYHEAFHQYIYYSVGKLAPHSWFNEGYGDYFSGAVFNSYGEVAKIGVNPWRIGTIQGAIERGKHIPWKDIIEFEQAEYYRPGLPCYAQGWSMIYFLNHSKDVQRNPAWKAILPTYFDTIKESHAREMAQLEASGLQDDAEQWAAAALRSREAAVKAAFEGIDLDAIEEAWLKYTLSLKPPK